MVPRHRNHWMDHLPGGVVHGDPVLLRKITNMFVRHSAERRNAECLRLISFVTLKVGERRPTSQPTTSMELFAANIVYLSSLFHSYLHLLFHPSLSTTTPLSPAYPHPSYRLLPDRIRTRHYPTPFTRSDGPLAKRTNIPYLPPSSPLFNQLDF